LPARWRWPRALRGKWLSLTLLVVYLWAYEAFALWNSPWLTAWIIAGYFVAALLVDGFFRGASFCKYVCPIGQFHFVTSLISPREVRVRNAAVCKTCATHDCIRGNQHARGCELSLFQPKKSSNLDCTFCLDCVKACPHDNVAILPVPPGSTLVQDPYRSSIGRLSQRTDVAALTLAIVFGAFANAVAMVEPVMMWKHRSLVVLAGVAIPAVAMWVCGRTRASIAGVIRRFAFTLVPVGVAMWAAHLFFHFANALSLPAIVAPTQLLLLDAGLLLSLYIGWRLANQYAARAMIVPWAALACALYTFGIWILFQPMQMRGMLG
jgi:ferredoxin